MKRIKLCLSAAFVALVSFSGCSENNNNNNNEDTGMYMLYKDYLIDSYVAADRLLFGQDRNSSVVKLYLTGPEYAVTSTDEAVLTKFRELAAQHGDEFRREIGVEFCYELGDYKCCVQDFVAVDVRSDTAWDDAHPAGSSLNDVCYLIAYSYASYIDNNYKGEQRTYIRKRPSDFSRDDLRMLEPGRLSLYFDKRPEHSEGQKITISFVAADGTAITASGRIDPIR